MFEGVDKRNGIAKTKEENCVLNDTHSETAAAAAAAATTMTTAVAASHETKVREWTLDYLFAIHFKSFTIMRSVEQALRAINSFIPIFSTYLKSDDSSN